MKPLPLVAGMADYSHVGRGTQPTIPEGHDMGYVYLGNHSPVPVAHVTNTTTAELASVAIPLADTCLKRRVLPIGLAASDWHLFTSAPIILEWCEVR